MRGARSIPLASWYGRGDTRYMHKTNKTPATETQAYEALRVAQLNEHRGEMASSAKLAAKDAEALFNKGEWDLAHARACDSLKYSLGIFASEYQRVAARG